jgi:hypothetical protein
MLDLMQTKKLALKKKKKEALITEELVLIT